MEKYSLILTATILVGCNTLGNLVISDDSLKEKAAFALETKPAKVTISNRRTDGLDAIKFDAKTGGRTYQCYITTADGLFSSDALCSKGGGKRNKKKSCNALLRAAGRC